MPLTDVQWDTWLKADNQQRVLLVEAKVYSGGAEVTRYFANRAYVSRPTDTPANQAYDDILSAAPYFSAQISEPFTGKSQASWGDLTILNENGARDGWLNDAWDGRALTLYLGDASWPKADFRTILVGQSADIVAPDRLHLSLRIRDRSWALNVPLQTNRIGGATANLDKLKPVCYGECFNVEPPLIDAALSKYQVHDGQVNNITAVRDNGVAVAVTLQLAAGTFTLNAARAGRITTDVQGAKPGATYFTKCADIIQDIVTTRTALAVGDIDAVSFAAFNALCPQKLGFYHTDYISVAAACDELVSAVGGFWTFDLSGKLLLGRLEAPAGAPAMELVADDVAEKGLVVKTRMLPVSTYRLGYARNYTPQTDGLAGAVTEANRALYAAEFQAKTKANAGVTAAHLLATNPALVGTLLVDPIEAQTECDRRAALWSTLRYVYEARCFAAPFGLRLGQTIKLYHPRYGFAAGQLAALIGYTWFPTQNRCVLELFR